ncbi:anion transporter [Anaerocolumna cellulosilytica]|uniref:Anion transporter n=1 Tax=Anaerocolumna cellulosilytica TaxID=433286 RepID=A0A6S6R9P1_9FIRM|nr:SLC13 family permease [Anaerocolumna cellulosilytica]MBB5196557.1 Na+/H+ antiporter NhaD/arsenite permease-like protein [Anaerocolumna cellulosilytica]BCJ95658.1 anion transporter [Anaerocolumna cellulosilytica]
MNKIMLKKFIEKLKTEGVLLTAGSFAAATMLIVPPSGAYLEYIDFRVLALLFCLMAVVAGFQQQGVFLYLAEKVLQSVKTTRGICMMLIMLCFISAMWITNDVALITFVPFTVLLLSMTGLNQYLTYVIVMQTIAANLGSMLTPVGNPQNLYLYSNYEMSILEFLIITLPYTVVSLLVLWGINLWIKKKPIDTVVKLQVPSGQVSKRPFVLVAYVILFLLCLMTVLHVLDYKILLLLVITAFLLVDRKVFKNVDYSLLVTFICFFVFVGNIGSIDSIRIYLSSVIEGKELLLSVLLSQIISNVPAAVLLSKFTANYQALVIGTNLGGLGTLVASLASLISFKIYIKTDNSSRRKYIVFFTLANAGFLLLLLGINSMLFL